jgi:hypothetical protein
MYCYEMQCNVRVKQYEEPQHWIDLSRPYVLLGGDQDARHDRVVTTIFLMNEFDKATQ